MLMPTLLKTFVPIWSELASYKKTKCQVMAQEVWHLEEVLQHLEQEALLVVEGPTLALPQHLCSGKALGQVLLVLHTKDLDRLLVRETSVKISCKQMQNRSPYRSNHLNQQSVAG